MYSLKDRWTSPDFGILLKSVAVFSNALGLAGCKANMCQVFFLSIFKPTCTSRELYTYGFYSFTLNSSKNLKDIWSPTNLQSQYYSDFGNYY